MREYGHRITVFEQEDKPGGLLRYGIPSFKLEKNFLDRRIDLLERKGVEFETLVTAGEDLSARYLKRKYDVLLLATGCTVPMDLPVQGRYYEEVYFAMEYLVQPDKDLSGSRLSPNIQGPFKDTESKKITARDKRVLVIGGGIDLYLQNVVKRSSRNKKNKKIEVEEHVRVSGNKRKTV